MKNIERPFEGKTIEMEPFSESDQKQCAKCVNALGSSGSCGIYMRKPDGVILGVRNCSYFEAGNQIDG